MEITGKIVAREGRVAQVMILRSSACGHSCETCGACAGKEHVILADDPTGHAIGQGVVVRVSDEVPLGTAFLVYIFPLLLCGGLCMLAEHLFGMAWLGLIPGFAVWGVLLYYMNRKKGRAGVDGTVIRAVK